QLGKASNGNVNVQSDIPASGVLVGEWSGLSRLRLLPCGERIDKVSNERGLVIREGAGAHVLNEGGNRVRLGNGADVVDGGLFVGREGDSGDVPEPDFLDHADLLAPVAPLEVVRGIGEVELVIVRDGSVLDRLEAEAHPERHAIAQQRHDVTAVGG